MDRNHFGKTFDKLLGIEITDLIMNLLPCHGFRKNINSTVILLCPSQMLEYYFPKVFFLERNSNNLKGIANETKYNSCNGNA